MILTVENIAKIQSAKIELDGITVIAGQNNSCKSIVAKSLFSLLFSFHRIDDKVIDERLANISRNLFFFYESLYSKWPLSRKTDHRMLFLRRPYHPSLKNLIQNKQMLRSEIKDILLSKVLTEQSGFPNDVAQLEGIDEEIEKLTEQVATNLSIDDNNLKKVLIQRCFVDEFSGQINHLNEPTKEGLIKLDAGNTLFAHFINNRCDALSENGISFTTAIYIDSPLIINEIDYRLHPSKRAHEEDIIDKFLHSSEDNAVDAIINEKKLEKIMALITSVTSGQFTEKHDDGDDEILFKEKTFVSPIKLANLSTGLKAFVLIQRLIENGSLSEGSVLIFDEPEIHLHPEWQLAFAEILVLLNKVLGITLLLNTHSPYFLNAIEVFSKHHSVSETCKYYLATLKNDVASVEDVTSDTKAIYKKLAEPFQTLENIDNGA